MPYLHRSTLPPVLNNTCEEIHYNLHPHTDLIIALANGAKGQVLRGKDNKVWVDESRDICLNAVINGFQSVRIKPSLKLIDWSKMPVGTVTNNGRISVNNLNVKHLYLLTVSEENTIYGFSRDTVHNLRLIEQTDFTYWSGGECPVPEGVLLEVVFRDGDIQFINKESLVMMLRWDHTGRGSDIIAYRITGLTDGYTDNLSEVVSCK